MTEKYTSNNIAVNEDGKTKLYELCSLTFLESESASKEVLDLIDSYPEEIRASIINKKVEIPHRVHRLNNRANISLEGYDIDDAPLHVAIRNEASLVIKKLLESGADINLRNKNGTPLEEAVNIMNPTIVETLLKAGAKVDTFESPLFLANDIEKTDPDNKDLKKIIKLLKAAQEVEIRAKTPSLVQAEQEVEIRAKTPSLVQKITSAAKNIFSFNSKSHTSVDLKKLETKILSSPDSTGRLSDISTAPPSPLNISESLSSTLSYGHYLKNESPNQKRLTSKKTPPPMPNSEEISKYRKEQIHSKSIEKDTEIRAIRAESATPPTNFSKLPKLATSISSYVMSLESAGLMKKPEGRTPPIISSKAKNKTQR